MKMNHITLGILFLILNSFVHHGASDEETKREELVTNDGDIEVLDIEGNYVVAEENDVMLLTRDNFKHVIHNREYVLVEFYAPWCGHCKSLEPEYSRAALALKVMNLTLGKVDATKETDLAKDYMITGFPTIILFKNGVKQEEFNGDRTADGIINYMVARTDKNWKPPPTSVIELTGENFSQFLESRPLVLVLFYAEYCKHCQQIKPEFANAAKVLKEYGVPLVQIEGTKYKDVADEYKITGWPTLNIFRNGRAFEYKGTRDEKGIIGYMKEQLKSPSTECKTLLEVENRVERLLPTIIGIFSSEKSKFYEEFFAVANFLRNEPLKFVHSFHKSVAKGLGVQENEEAVIVKKPSVFLSNYEKKEVALKDSSKSGDDIADFIRANYRPLVGQRTKLNQAFFYSVRPLVVVYYDANFDHQYQKSSEIVRSKVVEVAKEFPYITFAVANEDEFESELEAVKLSDSGVDVNVVWYDNNRLKYRMDPSDDFDGSDLRTFVHLANDDKLKPVWKSLPVPKNQEGPVQTVVADNFEEKVLKSKDQDIIFYVYAPWCGHCKQFEPTYKKMAKKMEREKILFVKMDGSGNDLPPGFEIKGYPTIFFIRAYKKHEPVLYDGDRSYSHLKKFINTHSTIFLSDEEREGRNKVEL